MIGVRLTGILFDRRRDNAVFSATAALAQVLPAHQNLTPPPNNVVNDPISTRIPADVRSNSDTAISFQNRTLLVTNRRLAP